MCEELYYAEYVCVFLSGSVRLCVCLCVCECVSVCKGVPLQHLHSGLFDSLCAQLYYLVFMCVCVSDIRLKKSAAWLCMCAEQREQC